MRLRWIGLFIIVFVLYAGISYAQVRLDRTSGQTPQAAGGDTVVNCATVSGIGDNYRQNGEYQRAYETHQYYIEQCAMEPKSYLVFSALKAENSARSSDLNRQIEFREWLKKVLYYNPDTLYYCTDVDVIISTVGGWFDSSRGADKNGVIALMEYIIASGKCPIFTDLYREKIKEIRIARVNTWQDTVTDPIATPLDTTLPSLEDLDLGILRGKLSTPKGKTSSGPSITDFSITRNPFYHDAILRYELAHDCVLRLDIFDILGRTVHTAGLGWLDEGDHSFTVAAGSWRAGTYYARLSTLSGEIKTIKFIKE